MQAPVVKYKMVFWIENPEQRKFLLSSRKKAKIPSQIEGKIPHGSAVHNVHTGDNALLSAGGNDELLQEGAYRLPVTCTNTINTRFKKKLAASTSHQVMNRSTVEVKSDGKCVIIETQNNALFNRWKTLVYYRYTEQLSHLLATSEIPALDKDGVLVDTKLLVKKSDSNDRDKLFVVTVYHTKMKLMLQGARVPHWFEMEYPVLDAIANDSGDIKELCDKAFVDEIEMIGDMNRDIPIKSKNINNAIGSITTLATTQGQVLKATQDQSSGDVPQDTMNTTIAKDTKDVTPQCEIENFATQFVSRILKSVLDTITSTVLVRNGNVLQSVSNASNAPKTQMSNASESKTDASNSYNNNKNNASDSETVISHISVDTSKATNVSASKTHSKSKDDTNLKENVQTPLVLSEPSVQTPLVISEPSGLDKCILQKIEALLLEHSDQFVCTLKRVEHSWCSTLRDLHKDNEKLVQCTLDQQKGIKCLRGQMVDLKARLTSITKANTQGQTNSGQACSRGPPPDQPDININSSNSTSKVQELDPDNPPKNKSTPKSVPSTNGVNGRHAKVDSECGGASSREYSVSVQNKYEVLSGTSAPHVIDLSKDNNTDSDWLHVNGDSAKRRFDTKTQNSVDKAQNSLTNKNTTGSDSVGNNEGVQEKYPLHPIDLLLIGSSNVKNVSPSLLLPKSSTRKHRRHDCEQATNFILHHNSYQPKITVLHVGANDINDGRSNKDVIERMTLLVILVRSAFTKFEESQIVTCAIPYQIYPGLENRNGDIDFINSSIQKFIETNCSGRVHFIGNDRFFNDDGTVRAELLSKRDGLHYTVYGTKLLCQAIKKMIRLITINEDTLPYGDSNVTEDSIMPNRLKLDPGRLHFGKRDNQNHPLRKRSGDEIPYEDKNIRSNSRHHQQPPRLRSQNQLQSDKYHVKRHGSSNQSRDNQRRDSQCSNNIDPTMHEYRQGTTHSAEHYHTGEENWSNYLQHPESGSPHIINHHWGHRPGYAQGRQSPSKPMFHRNAGDNSNQFPHHWFNPCMQNNKSPIRQSRYSDYDRMTSVDRFQENERFWA
jgi:hypothetical protein